MSKLREGLLAVHASVLLFGITALFSKAIALSALEITLLRSVFAALAIGLYIRWLGESPWLRGARDYAVATLLGVLLASHWVTYFHAMQVSSVAVGVIALYTFPVITVFLEPLFFNERPHLHDVVSAAAVVLGIYLLTPSFSLDNQTTIGVLWGVFSALLYALRNIIQRRYFGGYRARHALLYQTGVVFLACLPFAGAVVPTVSGLQWGQLLVLGIFFTALPHTLFAHSLLHMKAKSASLIACLQVVYATLFAALLLGEWPSATTVMGGGIIIATAMFESYMTGRAQAPARA